MGSMKQSMLNLRFMTVIDLWLEYLTISFQNYFKQYVAKRYL